MKRDIHKLKDPFFDVVIVGGGIHGATAAYHATLAGMKTALVDKSDFCHATSANSLKIIHGGLRYLQHLNIKRMRQSILSRRELMLFAPHLVRPLACIMPTYGFGLRGKEVMRLALLFNDIISWDRNKGIARGSRLPKGFTITKDKCLKVIPDIETKGLRGASLWHDALALNTERLLVEYIMAATENGAKAANYLEVKKITANDHNTYSIELEDKINGAQSTIRTRFVINAAGPWIDNICFKSQIHCREKHRWALALNIIVNKGLFPDHGVGLEGSNSYNDKDAVLHRGKRLYFFVPWRGYTMIGTDYKIYRGSPDNLHITKDDLRAMLTEINGIYPQADLKFSDVTFYHVGLLPASTDYDEQGNAVQLDKNSQIIDHETDGLKGIITIKGVKYTTAPYVAREVVKLLQKKNASKHPKPNEQTKNTPTLPKRESQPISPHLLTRYGIRSHNLAQYCAKDDSEQTWISTSPPLLPGEVEYFIQEEMALKLSDIVFRRTDLGTCECPPLETLEKLADLMAMDLDWDEKEKNNQINEVLERYSPIEQIHRRFPS